MINTFEEKFRLRLIEFRKLRGMSQQKLANLAEVSVSYYAEVESPNKSTNPGLKFLFKICNALGISVCDLFEKIDSDETDSRFDDLFHKKTVVFRNYRARTLADKESIIIEVMKFMAGYKYTGDDREKVKIAFSEMFDNAFFHGNQGDPSKVIQVTFYMTHEDVRLSFTDEGEGFDYAALVPPTNYEYLQKMLDKGSEEDYTHGRGIYLTREYMDNLRYNKKGNSVEITKFNANALTQDNPIDLLQRMTVSSWSELAEYRDRTTTEHLERMPGLVEIIAGELAKDPAYAQYLTKGYIADLKTASVLHDIGKVGISDTILLKESSLTAAEYEQIKQHVIIGSNFISKIQTE